MNTNMCKFESSQKDQNRAQSADSSEAYRNLELSIVIYYLFHILCVLQSIFGACFQTVRRRHFFNCFLAHELNHCRPSL